MRLGKQIRRVDVQVSILMIIVTIFCSSCIYLVCYRMTHRDMINSLEERVFAIYDFLEDSLDKTMFEEINTREDMEKKSYREMKRLLRQVKSATNMMYLYTAKKNEEGPVSYTHLDVYKRQGITMIKHYITRKDCGVFRPGTPYG